LPSQRVPEHEPWAGHENLHSSIAKTGDTFKQGVKREVEEKPKVEAEEEKTDSGATTESKEAGVAKPSSPAAVPKSVTNATAAVKTNLNPGSVGGLVNAVANAGKMAFGAVQSVIQEIDSVQLATY
jgi:hypothetical protein